jgi:hypothetical protein
LTITTTCLIGIDAGMESSRLLEPPSNGTESVLDEGSSGGVEPHATRSAALRRREAEGKIFILRGSDLDTTPA